MQRTIVVHKRKNLVSSMRDTRTHARHASDACTNTGTQARRHAGTQAHTGRHDIGQSPTMERGRATAEPRYRIETLTQCGVRGIVVKSNMSVQVWGPKRDQTSTQNVQ